MYRILLPIMSLWCLTSCSLLRTPLTLSDGSETTVGTIVANEVQAASVSIGDVISVLTGNPILGAATVATIMGVTSVILGRTK